MTTTLITGANRGIGLELARRLAATGRRVIGTARRPAEAQALSEVASMVLPLDTADGASIDALGRALEGEAIGLLINNAGIGGRGTATLGECTMEGMLEVLRVNAVGPLLVTRALRAGLEKAAAQAGAAEDRPGALVVNITSGLGSISRNTGGSSYGYRASKAALNMLTAHLHHELAPKGVGVVCIHPGWVRTDMGGPEATLSVEESAASMIGVIEGLKAQDSGVFFNHDGETIPW